MSRSHQLTLLLGLAIFLFGGCATVPYQPQVIQPVDIYHIVGSGQTLYSISKVYGIETRELMRINNIKDPNKLKPGQKIIIPIE